MAFRVLVNCPCCGHTLKVNRVLQGAMEAPYEPRVRIDTVKSRGGRGPGRGLYHVMQDVDPYESEGKARFVELVLSKLALQLEFAARRVKTAAEFALGRAYRPRFIGQSVGLAIPFGALSVGGTAGGTATATALALNTRVRIEDE